MSGRIDRGTMAVISALIIAKNEEANIRECLESIRWIKDIVVVDAGSVDKTVAVARKVTRKVYVKRWKGFGPARNFALSKCTGEWVLWIDADERVTPKLAEEIQRVVDRNDPSVHGYSVPRRAYFLGKWIRHCGWYPGRTVRLFRRASGSFSHHQVHERLIVSGNEAKLQSDLLHFTDPSLFHYFEKFNRYTSLAVDELGERVNRPGISDLFGRPVWTFVRMYFLRRGFLDGMHGFVLCLNSSFYVFTKYAKRWERIIMKSQHGAEYDA